MSNPTFFNRLVAGSKISRLEAYVAELKKLQDAYLVEHSSRLQQEIVFQQMQLTQLQCPHLNLAEPYQTGHGSRRAKDFADCKDCGKIGIEV